MSIPSPRPLEPPVSRITRLPQPLRADQPLCLGEMAEPLRVVSGFVDLFAVDMQAGRHVGRRRAVARLSAGDCFWPVPRALDGQGDGLGLIAVGGLGAQVEALGEGPALADIDHWLRAILPPAPAAAGVATVLAPGRHELNAGQLAAIPPGQGCLWLLREEGLLALPEGGGVGDLPLPLVAGRWVQADGAARIALRTTRELADAGLLAVALKGAHAALPRQIAHAQAAQAQQQAAQARQRDALARQGMEEAFGALVAMIRPDDPAALVERVPPGWEASAAIRRIAQSLGVATPSAPPAIGSDGRPPDLTTALAAARMRQRAVLLRPGWWQQAGLPMLARLSEGERLVTLLPHGDGYQLWEPLSGQLMTVDAALADRLNPQAQVVYPSLPPEPVGLRGLMRLGMFGAGRTQAAIFLLALAAAVIGLLVPVAAGLVVDKIVPTAAGDQLLMLVLALAVAAVSSAALDYSKAHAVLRMQSGIDLKLHAAVVDRLLRLPAGFFKNYTVGDLADRAMGIATIREMLAGAALSSLLGGVMSLVSLGVLFFYSVKLAFVALGLVALSLVVTVGLCVAQLAHERKEARSRGVAEGLVLQFITGVAKLKVAAAVDRAIIFWMRRYADQRQHDIAGQRMARMQTVFQSMFGPFSTIMLMLGLVLIAKGVMAEQAVQALAGVEGGSAGAMKAGGFIAFFTAFSQFQGVMTQLVATLTRLLGVLPIRSRFRPLLESPLDEVPDGEDAGRLGGGVEFSGVSFSYAPDLPPVLDNLSFSIRPGEFVAIVGPSGSGKSTILRLLLGLDRPQAGELFFDGRPMSRLTPDSVRRQIGTVLQNGRLLGGSILDNIVGASAARLEDAWAAARQVDLADDIKAMPMGMHTVLTEGGGTLSGGQRQRLMIARALVRQPRLLLLDEATSALDNRTQAAVMRSLEKLDVTRVMIAHRLSTIERVDRILVIERGRLVEQGGFAELIAKDGVFAALARRQML